jgi:hypothetical protein
MLGRMSRQAPATAGTRTSGREVEKDEEVAKRDVQVNGFGDRMIEGKRQRQRFDT